MFTNVSERITNSFIQNKTILAEDKDIYLFGIQQTFTIMLNVATVIILGLLIQMLGHSILFMVAFIPLRIFAGGFHAKTPVRCYISSTVFLSAILLAMRFIETSNLINCVLYIVSSLIILWLAPVEDRNKPLDELEVKVYRKRAIILWGIESIVLFISFFLNLTLVLDCLLASLLSVAMIVALGAIKNKVTAKS